MLLNKFYEVIVSFGVPDPLGCIMTAPVDVLTSSDGALSAHLAIPLHLEGDQEGCPIEEQEVLFPLAWVVVCFSVDTFWHGPDCVATHFFCCS